jgi:hypothetical protein
VQQEQQQQQQQQSPAVGRPVDEWMVRETRPRIADALADGVLPIADDVNNMKQQLQQQEVAG